MTESLWRDTRFWLVVFAATGWTLFLILFAQNRAEKPNTTRRDRLSAPAPMDPEETTAREAAEPGLRTLAGECSFFAVSELNMPRLRMILEDAGLRLVYPRALRGLQVKALNLAGSTLGEIIVGLVRPQDHGVTLQNDTVEIIPMDTAEQKDDARVIVPGEPAPPATTTHVKMEKEIATETPAHFWIEDNPLIRLSLTIHPLHGENETDRVLLQLAAYRNRRLWFQSCAETTAGRAARVDIDAAEAVWCQVAPNTIEDGAVRVTITFHHQGAPEESSQ